MNFLTNTIINDYVNVYRSVLSRLYYTSVSGNFVELILTFLINLTKTTLDKLDQFFPFFDILLNRRCYMKIWDGKVNLYTCYNNIVYWSYFSSQRSQTGRDARRIHSQSKKHTFQGRLWITRVCAVISLFFFILLEGLNARNVEIFLQKTSQVNRRC